MAGRSWLAAHDDGFETPSSDQMQIDFGEKWVTIGGQLVRVFLLVVALSYSRRLFARALVNQPSDDWREGIAAAFRYVGGGRRTLPGDDAKTLVLVAAARQAPCSSIPCISRSAAWLATLDDVLLARSADESLPELGCDGAPRERRD